MDLVDVTEVVLDWGMDIKQYIILYHSGQWGYLTSDKLGILKIWLLWEDQTDLYYIRDFAEAKRVMFKLLDIVKFQIVYFWANGEKKIFEFLIFNRNVVTTLRHKLVLFLLLWRSLLTTLVKTKPPLQGSG